MLVGNVVYALSTGNGNATATVGGETSIGFMVWRGGVTLGFGRMDKEQLDEGRYGSLLHCCTVGL